MTYELKITIEIDADNKDQAFDKVESNLRRDTNYIGLDMIEEVEDN